MASQRVKDIMYQGTKAYDIARTLADKRRKQGVPLHVLTERFGASVSAYLSMYDCFVRMSNGNWTYQGDAFPN